MAGAQSQASVIVRTKDSARTLRSALGSIRSQSVESEIVVVDSGSTDDTVSIAKEFGAIVVSMPAEQFSFGRGLNLGASRASAPIHFALSSHCVLPRDDYVERSLAFYERPDVAATHGKPYDALGRPLLEPYFQSADDAYVDPYWGYSNHAASWRADVWRHHPFNEQIEACEDLEWAWRVLNDGYVIVFDPRLVVATNHRIAQGIRPLFNRSRREARALARYLDVEPRTLRAAIRQWWYRIPPNPPYPPLFYRANYWKVAEIFGRYVGQAEARRERRDGGPE
jgi:rhamnosyltransferase